MTATFNDTYEIKSQIGKGGMSTVYLAEHKRLHTRWAVKEVKKQQGARFDFLAESNILKRLQHPMLPRIVDIFEDRNHIYIVEDFVEGITLEDLLRQQKRVDEAQALQWFRSLCGVLEYLHNQKPHPIIYRDMKPANIMLQPDGSLKLIDFGIAREFKQEAASDTTYIGTKGYAAPEQFGKAQTDARTDIYSLGITMYHLVTGKSPYEPPYNFIPVRQLNGKLSAGIEYVLDKCIQSEPEARYQDVGELLYDLENIYRFDKAWKKFKNAKRARTAVIIIMLIVSLGLMLAGRKVLAKEKEADYLSLLEQAEKFYSSDSEKAVMLLDKAQGMFPNRVESYSRHVYVLYLAGEYEECARYGEEALELFDDGSILISVASAYFELGEYEKASDCFFKGAKTFEMNADSLRDYAVCLGRMGEIESAERMLGKLKDKGASPEATAYVQGEVYLAMEKYAEAERAFLSALDETKDRALLKRCYISLGELYRDCAALNRINESPVPKPATKSAALLSEGLTVYGWQHDSVLWEMLAMAYFEAYRTDGAPADYLLKAADCFNTVLGLGVQKAYLYTNLYTIYYEMGDYDKAESALGSYEKAFPDDYMPSALRGMMLITIENGKPQSGRDYSKALAQYEKAGGLIKNTDDTSYYQQLGSLIQSLRDNGWLQ